MLAAVRPGADVSSANRHSLKARLGSYGLAGVASYGLLNTVYYITAFFFFWTHVVKVPKGAVPAGMPSGCSRPEHSERHFVLPGCNVGSEQCSHTGLGLATAAKQCATVMSLTWAGSQVTKVGPALCLCMQIWQIRQNRHAMLSYYLTPMSPTLQSLS